MSENIKLNDGDICNHFPELLGSRKFWQFLQAYNRRMIKQDPSFQPILPQDANKYEVAKKLYDEWEKMQVSGQVKTVSMIQDSIKRFLFEVKFLDCERKLDGKEVEERISALGINLPEIMKKSEDHYKKMGYADGLRKIDWLGEDEEYTLPLPEINELEMEGLEKAFKSGTATQLFVDDARLTGRETLELFCKKMPAARKKNFVNKVKDSLPFTENEFSDLVRKTKKSADPKYIQGVLADMRAALNIDLARQVRLFAFRPNILPPASESTCSPQDSLLNNIGGDTIPMNLGTYLRLCGFMKNNHPQVWKNMVGNDQGIGPYRVATGLNNINPDGTILCVEGDTPSGLKFSNVSPAENVFYMVMRNGVYAP